MEQKIKISNIFYINKAPSFLEGAFKPTFNLLESNFVPELP